MSTVDLLEEYKELLDKGVISQEEFDAKKAELLSKMDEVQEAAQNAVPSEAPAEAAAAAAPVVEAAAQAAKPAGEFEQIKDASFEQAQQPVQTPNPSYQTYQEPVRKERKSPAWGVLGFFIPLVGLILFIVWRNTNPIAAKYSGIGALIGFGLSVISSLITNLGGSM